MKKVLFITDIPANEGMPFDRWDSDHYIHATGRELWGYDCDCEGKEYFRCETEYEDSVTVNTPTTDILKFIEEMERDLACYEGEYKMAQIGDCTKLIPEDFYDAEQQLAKELYDVLEWVYELWCEDALDNYDLVIPEDLEQVFNEWSCEERYPEELPFD